MQKEKSNVAPRPLIKVKENVYLTIRNVGPITDTGRLSLSPVTLVIGEQSTGKSTLMKILCFCQWVEKHIMLDGNNLVSAYTHYSRFRKELMKYHRISEDSFSEHSYVRYESDALTIELTGKKGNAKITRSRTFTDVQHNYKLCFMPAERNLLSAVVRIDKVYRSNDFDMLFNYIMEWGEARAHYTSDHPLPLAFKRDMKFYYDEARDQDVLLLENVGKRIKPFYASSGVQSALPIALMSNYLSSVVGQSAKTTPKDMSHQLQTEQLIERLQHLTKTKGVDNELVNKITRSLTELVGDRNNMLTRYMHFNFYVEEPEQNLFPTSQHELLRSLIFHLHKAYEKTQVPSRMMLTTHSPYILTALNVMMQATVATKIDADKTLKIVSKEEILPLDWYTAYYIKPDGKVENLIDEEDHFIKGDYLDAISSTVDELSYQLNEIIYAND